MYQPTWFNKKVLHLYWVWPCTIGVRACTSGGVNVEVGAAQGLSFPCSRKWNHSHSLPPAEGEEEEGGAWGVCVCKIWGIDTGGHFWGES